MNEEVVQPPEPQHSGLVAASVIFAVLMPIIGFVLGVITVAKGRVGWGIISMVLSVVVFMVAYSYFAGQAEQDFVEACLEYADASVCE